MSRRESGGWVSHGSSTHTTLLHYLGDAEDGGDGVDGEDEVGELDAEQAHEEGGREALAVPLRAPPRGDWIQLVNPSNQREHRHIPSQHLPP